MQGVVLRQCVALDLRPRALPLDGSRYQGGGTCSGNSDNNCKRVGIDPENMFETQ